MMASIELQNDKTNGRWTKEQHQNFLIGLQMYGKNWKKIEELIGTRNGSQIRSHAQKFFLKFKNTYSNDSNSEAVEQAKPENETMNSKYAEEPETKCSEYSYFLQRIVKYSSNQGPFDFWQTFIDHQQSHSDSMEQIQKKRKDSFISFDEDGQQEQELSSPHKKLKI